MESYSQNINFENVQKNIKPHNIGSERKEFCQSIHAEFIKRDERLAEIEKVKSKMTEVYKELKMKVPVVRSVSNPLEDADQANLKENSETKQDQKCHKNKVSRRKYFQNLKKRILRLFHCCVSPSLEDES
ncbi:uncharacterized protein LOC134256150 [Saccostrea cucullata]|uniref:uncharacterized protein LOC134256150 n=1 Tax=Saccostrea cuccullata TaxID=36930 RepID=UPI002ED1F5EF